MHFACGLDSESVRFNAAIEGEIDFKARPGLSRSALQHDRNLQSKSTNVNTCLNLAFH